MQSISYTLDRYENDYAIFLKRPDECEQLIVHRTEMLGDAQQGDICEVSYDEGKFIIRVLEQQTRDANETAKALLAKLRSKKKK